SHARPVQLKRAELTDEERRCAQHVLEENNRVVKAYGALLVGDLGMMGKMMYESHASLKNKYRVSCPELDTIVGAARKIGGVYGARMVGAGVGGCASVLADPGSCVA